MLRCEELERRDTPAGFDPAFVASIGFATGAEFTAGDFSEATPGFETVFYDRDAGSSSRVVVTGFDPATGVTTVLASEFALASGDPAEDTFRGGVSITTLHRDGRDVLVASAPEGSGGGPLVRVWRPGEAGGTSFYVGPEGDRSGVRLMTFDFDTDGTPSHLAVTTPGGTTLSVFDAEGALLATLPLRPGEKVVPGGISVADERGTVFLLEGPEESRYVAIDGSEVVFTMGPVR